MSREKEKPKLHLLQNLSALVLDYSSVIHCFTLDTLLPGIFRKQRYNRHFEVLLLRLFDCGTV